MKTTLASVGVSLSLLSTTLAAPAHAAPTSGPPPAIDWQQCEDDDDPTWQCATLEVPLDHAQPDGPQLTKHLRRHAATDSAQRVGTLVVNPGGPGTPATTALWGYYLDLPADVTSRFDLLAIDARGADPEQPTGCFGDGDPSLDRPSYDFFPYLPGHVAQRLKRDRVKGQICADHPSALMHHMSGASSARDIELVRERLGEDQLSFYSHAYGTHLTAVYASLYPRNVRASVADSVVDSNQFFGSVKQGNRTPLHLRLGSHTASREAFFSAMSACVASDSCAYKDSIEADWVAVEDRLKKGPLVVNVWGVPFTLKYDGLLALVRAQTSYSENVVDALRLVHTAKQAVDAEAAGETAPDADGLAPAVRLKQLAAHPRHGDAGPSSNVDLSRVGVLCSDAYNPRQAWQYPSEIARANRESSGFASLWGWETSLCPALNIHDEMTYKGGISTSYTPLIMHSTHDSALPLEGARSMRKHLPGSRLVTVDQWESSVRYNNTCAMNIAKDYLISGHLPDADKLCANEKDLFS